MAVPTRARSRCSSINSSKPWSSTDSPCSASSSLVRSYGNPYVSCSLKASEASTQEVPACCAWSIRSSSSSVPRSRVRPKLSSSSLTHRITVSRSEANPGNGSSSRSRAISANRWRKGDSIPMERPCWIARRMIRRSTYPRSSFEGTTPSAIRAAVPREWSARILIARVVLPPSEYERPERSSASSTSGHIRSVSKTEGTSSSRAAMRSTPIPVSTLFWGSGLRLPSSARS